MYVLQTFVRDNKLSFSKRETDRLIKVMEASRIESSRTPKLYDNSGAKKSVVWKYFGFIKAKNGPATKTNLMWQRLEISYVGNHTLTKESIPSTINMNNQGLLCSKNVSTRKIARYQILSPVPKSWSQKI